MFSNIQALRAFAGIAVFFHHAGPHYGALNGQFEIGSRLAEWGFIGVDIFFVISGFVICHTTLHKERTLKSGKRLIN
jgi:peptidoglycan/LPS O-acetylase OafA/YrhL